MTHDHPFRTLHRRPQPPWTKPARPSCPSRPAAMGARPLRDDEEEDDDEESEESEEETEEVDLMRQVLNFSLKFALSNNYISL